MPARERNGFGIAHAGSETGGLEYTDPKITRHARSLYNELTRKLHVNFTLEQVRRKKCVSFRLRDGTELCSILHHEHKIEIVYAVSEKYLWQPIDFVADISDVKHYSNGDYRSYIETESDVQRAMHYVEIAHKYITGAGERYVPRY